MARDIYNPSGLPQTREERTTMKQALFLMLYGNDLTTHTSNLLAKLDLDKLEQRVERSIKVCANMAAPYGGWRTMRHYVPPIQDLRDAIADSGYSSQYVQSKICNLSGE